MVGCLGSGLLLSSCGIKEPVEPRRPNILFVISDDQSFAHTGFAGSRLVKTPAFDRVASEGIYFTTCIAGSPGCAPSRSSLVTGRHHWQNETSGQHASSWMKQHIPFIDLLEQNGYTTGRTGKGVSPFRYAQEPADSLWRSTDAGGIAHSNIRYGTHWTEDERPSSEISDINYFENFKFFLEQVRGDQPFFFWYGAQEPHRSFEKGSWQRHGKLLSDAKVPEFLPDHDEIRGDLLDYAIAIEWFDLHLQRMIDYLEEIGELDNTIVVVTSDNGMAFPRAKANSYLYGIQVPLAIRYPQRFPGGRVVDDPVGFADFAPTLLEATQTAAEGMLPMSGRSFLNLLTSGESGKIDPARNAVFTGRERHSSSRYLNRGYPQRAIVSDNYLLIWNMSPNLWPAGDPQRIKPGSTDELLPMYGIDEDGKHRSDWAFTDVDAAPSKSFLVEQRSEETVKPYFDLAFAKRPEFELYDTDNDPYNLRNLYGDPAHATIQQQLQERLMQELEQTGDPRVTGPDKQIFDTYIRYSPMREFPPPTGE